MDFSQLLAKVYEIITVYGLRVIAAIAILIIGRWVAKLATKLIRKLLVKNKVDETLTKFVTGLSYTIFLVFIVIAALNQLGIQTASFIAIVGAAGLAIGLALQGSLANFAAGVLMIIFRPFKVGDYVEGGGTAGVVEEVGIFTSQLKTLDNKTVIVPNSKMMGDNITNYTAKGTRRVDMVFGIGYGDDIDRAREIIKQVVTQDSRVFQDPAPVIVVGELGDSSVNLTTRVWSTSDDYWGVYFDTLEKVKKQFDREGISIPFPQRDVHLFQQ